MRNIEGLVDTLRERAAGGATMVELIDLVHEAEAAPKYSRGLVMHWFSRAFGLTAQDFTNVVFACKIFGDGASAELPDIERRFKARLSELAGGS